MRGMFWGTALAVGLAGCGLSGAARADSAYDKCIEKSDGTNSAWSECGGAWVEREDARLNAAWKAVFGGLSGQTHDDLLTEQRAWNAYKEKSCEFYANGDWGREGTVLNFPTCRAEVIAARTAYLKELAKFFNGQ